VKLISEMFEMQNIDQRGITIIQRKIISYGMFYL